MAETSHTTLSQIAQPILTPPLLSVRMQHRQGTLDIDVEFKLDQPWTILFGPSGSGKTTILRAIAGLLLPDHGLIVSTGIPGSRRQNSITLLDTSADLFVPPHHRGIRLAAQQPNPFPHMTVFENLAYGMQSSFETKLSAEKAVREVMESFGLTHLSASRPNRLSGGELQRLNLARAVAASDSRMLLLDEPFTGMDAARRDQLLPCLEHKLARRALPVLSVTHDVAEAFQLGAEVIKLTDGRVVDQGPVERVLLPERKRLLNQLNSAD